MSTGKFLQFLIPKDKKFFPLFEKSADNLTIASDLLVELLSTDDLARRDEIIQEINRLEGVGDEITHSIYDELNRSFITPFDREDIHELTSKLDDVLDLIDSSAHKIRLYNVNVFPSHFREFAVLIKEGVLEIKTAVYLLRDLRQHKRIKEACIQINNIENKADTLFEVATIELFEWETNAIELIKKSAIIQSLEKATDKAEDVSDVIKAIIVKQA